MNIKNTLLLSLLVTSLSTSFISCEETQEELNEELFNELNNLRTSRIRHRIKYGANINAQNKSGQTPLIKAMQYPFIKYETISLLLEYGADVNIQDNRGKTALMYAIETQNDITLVELILKAGADVNIQDSRGRTALDRTLYLDTIVFSEIFYLLKEHDGKTGDQVDAERAKKEMELARIVTSSVMR